MTKKDRIWKDVIGYEGLYQISNYGEIKSYEIVDSLGRVRPSTILKYSYDKDGYAHCNLSCNGKHRKYTVHRLVATAFIPNTENKPTIDHINGDKTDNRVSNLRWATHKENSNNENTKVTGENHHNYGKITPIEVREKISKSNLGKTFTSEQKLKMSQNRPHKSISQYTLDGIFIQSFNSIKEASEKLMLRKAGICNCLKGRYTHCGGFKFKYNQ